MGKATAKTTVDHQTIREWAEARGGKPARVRTGNGREGDGLLRINFPGYAEDNLENISWDEFFEVFDGRKLEFLFQDETADGHESRFFKFIYPEGKN
jgi:hypothetical protein